MRVQIGGFHSNIRKYPLIALFSLIAGICIGVLIYIYHFQFPLFSKSRFLIAFLLPVISAIAIFIFIQKHTLPQFQGLKKEIKILVLILIVCSSLLLYFNLNFNIPHLYFLYPSHHLKIDMDLSVSDASTDGISFSFMRLPFRDVSFEELKITGWHEIRTDSIFFPVGQTASIEWQGITGEEAIVNFLSAPKSVPPISIYWDGVPQELELTQSTGRLVSSIKSFPVLPSESFWVRLLILPIIAIVLWILISGLLSPHPYASIMLTGWLFIYLVYWPGIIGDVNIDAVNELIAGHPTNWHPILFTLLTAFSMRFLASASSLLIIQFVSLAMLFGMIFSVLAQKGMSKTVLLITSLLITILPTNFLTIITLTNDIPYSIALLALTFLAYKIVESDGEWMDKVGNRLLLSLTASLSILFRYNGIPAVVFFFLCLLIMFPGKWLKSLMCLSLVLLVWLAVSGPLSTYLNVANETEGHLDNILLHHISAHVTSGTPLTIEESQYLDQLLPLDEWRYSCCTNTYMWLNPEFDKETFHANSAFNRELALDLFFRDPRLEFSHMLCASEIVWKPFGCECSINYPAIGFSK